MKKQIFKIGILMSAGFFGAMASIYLVFDVNIPMALVVTYFIVSVAMVGIAFGWLNNVLSNNLK